MASRTKKKKGKTMNNPTDTNQASEDKLRDEILTEFKQVYKLAPADYTENCTNVVMSIIRTEKLKLLAEIGEPKLKDAINMKPEQYEGGVIINDWYKNRISKLEAEL